MLSLLRCYCCILLLKFINWHPVNYARAAAALLALWINGYLLTSSLKLTVESWNQQMDFMGFALILWRHETSSVGQLIRGRFKTDSWIWVEWQSSDHFESAHILNRNTVSVGCWFLSDWQKEQHLVAVYNLHVGEHKVALFIFTWRVGCCCLLIVYSGVTDTKLSFIYSYLTYLSGSLGRRIFFSSLLPLTLSAK